MSQLGPPASIVDLDGLDAIIRALQERGYRTVGPTVRDGAITYADVSSVVDLPAGWTDEQAAGHYRLQHDGGETRFAYAVGPQGPKRELYPPRLRLFTARRAGDVTWEADGTVETVQPLALVGVRPCELAAIAIHDRVFLGGPYADTFYAARRDGLFTVAVNCAEPGGTCFCASMGTGPDVAGHEYDLALTELVDEDRHVFLVDVGSKEGAAVLESAPTAPATDGDRAAADAVTARARRRMGCELDTHELPQLLRRNVEHPRWEEVAERCLTCGNCTLVCPTCFCTTVEDTTDLVSSEAYRDRRWDSCFTIEFTHAGPSSVRTSAKARYRQWLTHKLGTWVEQFGTSGCVGCGRCITWCPVGIDITEEAAALRTSGSGAGPSSGNGGAERDEHARRSTRERAEVT